MEEGLADPRTPRTEVSASEAANYVFCAKAWHLEHVLGVAASTAGADRRAMGVAAHAEHGESVRSERETDARLERVLVRTLLMAMLLLIYGLVLLLR